jgi:tripartite-type tricarboxylate transporter receptor subunit TctC
MIAKTTQIERKGRGLRSTSRCAAPRTVRRLRTGVVGFLGMLAATQVAQAQTIESRPWPEHAVRLIVPLPPGSSPDLAARLMAEHLAKRWGQPVVVENRQGADGIPAVTAFLGDRDNHTLLFSFAGLITINPLLHESLPYDPAKDLVPIVPVSDDFLGIAATAALKASSLDDLVKVARAQPGKINWAATPGLPYYILLALQKQAGIDMVQVSYRDFGPAFQDLTQGRLQVAATGVHALAPHHEAGTIKLVVVTSRERSPQAPDVPTAKEAGYPGLTFDGTIGFYGWRDMPPALKEKIAADVNAVTTDPTVRAKLLSIGVAPRTGTPVEFAAAIEEQRAKIAAIHRSGNAKPQP